MSNTEALAVDEEPEPDPRRCSEVKADGSACKGWATASGKCAGHSGLGFASDPIAANVKAAEVRRERHEAGKGATLAALERELTKHLPGIAANWAKQAQSDHRAAETLLARLYGKPTERVELGEIALDAEALKDPETRAAMKERLLTQHPSLRIVLGEQEPAADDAAAA